MPLLYDTFASTPVKFSSSGKFADKCPVFLAVRLNYSIVGPSMTQSFFFGFQNDDIEEGVDEAGIGNGDEMVDVGPSHDHPENKPVAVMEPRLHKLEDLV